MAKTPAFTFTPGMLLTMTLILTMITAIIIEALSVEILCGEVELSLCHISIPVLK